MTWLNDLPDQRKLGFAMLLTSTVALFVVCVVFLMVEYLGYRLENDLAQSRATGFSAHHVIPATINVLEEAIASLHLSPATSEPSERRGL